MVTFGLSSRVEVSSRMVPVPGISTNKSKKDGYCPTCEA